LNEVLDRRLGIPISLSVLYMVLARGLGVHVAGVNLPAHFVLRMDDGLEDPPLFIDAFHSGAFLDAAGCERLLKQITVRTEPLPGESLTRCATGMIVARMLRNLKAIYVGRREFARALPVVRRLSALDHRNPTEQRDHGLVSVQAGCPGEAINPLTAYLKA